MFLFSFLLFLVIRHRFFWSGKKYTILNSEKTTFISHRGYKKKYPENTIRSIESAKKKGFQWVEIDLVSTSDNIVICSHNLDLETETNGAGYIHDMLYEKIKSLHTGVYSHPQEIQRIPTLLNVFSKFTNEMKYNLEIKTRSTFDLRTVRETIRLIKKMEILNCMVSSFNPVVILYLKLFHKKVNTALLLESVKYLWLVNWLHPDFLNIRADMISNVIVRHSKNHGYGLIAWTVNSEMGIHFCLEKKLSGIITDRNLIY